jgi:hypothetical protein
VPAAGIFTSRGICTIASGVPFTHSSGNVRGAGACAGSPFGAPASIQAENAARSASVSARLLEKWPTAGSACHGGMRRSTRTSESVGRSPAMSS